MEGIHRRLPPIAVTESLRKRFDSKVERGEPDDCWPWLAGFRNGYGAIKIQGRVYSCHRVAYILANGEPDSGLVVAHKCDNKACCNPSHLEAVSISKNNRDAFERIGHMRPCGTQIESAVLTEQIVRELRQMHVPGKVGAVTIARRMGHNVSTVKNVISGYTWKHVSERPEQLNASVVASEERRAS